jgi:hypothetical protein
VKVIVSWGLSHPCGDDAAEANLVGETNLMVEG